MGEAASQAFEPRRIEQDQVPLDKAAELQVKWATGPGQIWDIAGSQLYCGDSRAVPPRFFRETKIRLLWTDPPYGVSYAAKNKFLNESGRGNRIQKEIANDHLTPDATEALFVEALVGCVPYCEPGAAIYATVPGGPLYGRFLRGLETAGFTLHAGLIWLKQHFVLGRSDYHYRHEPILYGWLSNGAHVWASDRSQDSVFQVDKPAVSDLHPTTKPVGLVAAMIANSSHPAEIIYDPFCGSGTAMVAAYQLGRIAYGVEIDPGYAAVTLERLATFGLTPRREDAA
jgi:DNA modification methylase